MARSGDDPEAFATLFQRHVDDVFGFVWRRTRDDALADDITAVVFENCWKQRAGFRPTSDTVRPWLFRIAANALASHYRSEGRRRDRERLVAVRDQPLRSDDGATIVNSFAEQGVLDALGLLRARHQEVLTLRYLADLTTEEAARALGVTRGHFAVLQHRAIAALRRAVQGGSR